jgi:hypothetical protein
VNTCVQLFPTQALCASEGGVWWGVQDAAQDPVATGSPQPDCCSVNKFQLSQVPAQPTYSVLPDWQMAMRDDHYKLVSKAVTDYDPSVARCSTTKSTELYLIDDKIPPKLDDAASNLLRPPRTLNAPAKLAYQHLSKALTALLDSNVPCTGDGNQDGVVNQDDIDQFNYWANVTGSKSSWYDLNLDGLTNQNDVSYITAGAFPRNCPQAN